LSKPKTPSVYRYQVSLGEKTTVVEATAEMQAVRKACEVWGESFGAVVLDCIAVRLGKVSAKPRLF
jgi:hypothetical protein